MSTWLSDSTANRYRKTYFNGFVDVSGGDIILRSGNIKLLSGEYPTISSNNNTITFDDIYQFTNFNNNVHILGIQQLDYGGTVYDVGSLISQIGSMTYYQPSDFNIFNNIYCAGQIQYLEAGTGAHVDLVGKVLTNINDIATNTTNIATNTTNIATNTSSITTLNTQMSNRVDKTSNETIGGTKTFSSPPNLSGAGITSSTINAGAVVGTAVTLSGAQTITGIKTFSAVPVLSGASISTGTIPIASVVGTAMDLTTTQTVAGVKTFSSPPVLSGASITSATIPITSVVGTAVSLNTSQTISGQKTFSATPLFTANVAIYGSMYLNNLALLIPNTTLQKIQYLSTVSSDVQTQLNQKIGLGNNNTYTGFNDFNNAVSFNSQFYIASASPLIQIENGNTLRQWSSGTTGDTVMELAWDKGASTTGFSLQGGNDGTRGLFGLYFCTNVAAGTRIPIMYSKDTGTQANNILTIGSGTLATTNITYSGNLNSVSSTTFGYISGLTSSAQTQLDNKANLTTTNNFTGSSTFTGQFASLYNASGTIYGSQTELFLTGHRPYANGGDPTNGSNVFEISLDTGFYKRGFTIQGGESSTNTSAVKRSIFGLYYRTYAGGGTDPTRTPIMYGTDQETGSSLDNTLTIPSSLRMTGTLKLNGGEEISNTQLGYLTTLSENVQSSLNSLKTKLTDLVWTSGSPNKTTIVNTTETSTLTFSNTLNGISTGVFSYLSGLTANIQDQFTSMKARTPVGSIIMYLKGDLGSPFIFCDGRELNRSSASALFAVIGTTYGAGDGSTTFNIPDMTAIFVRGFGSRTINGVAYASTTGSTLQIDAMEAHTHSSNLSGTFLKTGTSFNVPGFVNGSSKPNESNAPASTGGVNTAYRTSNETRPINLPVYYYICAS